MGVFPGYAILSGLLLARWIHCCEDGAYCSKDLRGCVECPEYPLLHCTGVHKDDVDTCLKDCAKLVTAKPNHDEQQPKNRTAGLTGQESKDVEYKSNNLVMFFVFVAGLVTGILIRFFINKIKNPMKETAKESFNKMHLFVSTYPKSKEETSPVNRTDNELMTNTDTETRY